MTLRLPACADLASARLPRWAPALVGGDGRSRSPGSPRAAVRLGSGRTWVVAAIVVFLVAMPLWSRLVEGRRAAVDRLVTALIWTAFAVALLAAGLAAVRRRSAAVLRRINGSFLTYVDAQRRSATSRAASTTPCSAPC